MSDQGPGDATPKAYTLIDNFNSGTIDPAVWATDAPGFGFSGPVSVVDDQVGIAGVEASTYGAIQSIATFDLTSSGVFSQLVDAGDQSGSFDVYPLFLSDSNSHLLGWECNAGTLYMIFPGISSIPLPYDPSLHKWFRIYESGGYLNYDWSTDGLVWNNAYSDVDPTPDLIDLTALQCGFVAGFQGDAGGQTQALFDNFNILAVPNPKVSTLVDDFNSGVIDQALWMPLAWSDNPAPVTIVNGQLCIPGGGFQEYSGVQSVGLFDLTGSEVFTQLVDAGDQSSGSTFDVIPLFVVDSVGNGHGYEVYNGSIGIDDTNYSGDIISYDPAVHKWFRLSESGGTFSFDYSTDGTTWTSFFSTPVVSDLTSCFVVMFAGFQDTPSADTTAIFDNVNIVGAPIIPTGSTPPLTHGGLFLPSPNWTPRLADRLGSVVTDGGGMSEHWPRDIAPVFYPELPNSFWIEVPGSEEPGSEEPGSDKAEVGAQIAPELETAPTRKSRQGFPFSSPRNGTISQGVK